jgi:AcrR family transcriptional regulator
VRAILDAAERILRDPAESLTTNRVAEVAGVSIGSVYEYFPTKQAIARAVEERSWSGIAHAIAQLVPRLVGRKLADAIRDLVAAAIDAIIARGRVHGYTVADPDVLVARLEHIERCAQLLEQVLRAHAGVALPELRLPIILCIKTVSALAWLGDRDHRDACERGELQREVGDMVARYVLGIIRRAHAGTSPGRSADPAVTGA